MQNLPQFDTQSIHQKVKDFRYKMGLTVSVYPRLMTWEELSFCTRFITEEMSELLKAHEDGDLVAASDAIADIIYVIIGASHIMGLPLEKILNVVHIANMSKEPGATKRHRHDVKKPNGWVGPEESIRLLLLEKQPPTTTSTKTQLRLFDE